MSFVGAGGFSLVFCLVLFCIFCWLLLSLLPVYFLKLVGCTFFDYIYSVFVYQSKKYLGQKCIQVYFAFVFMINFMSFACFLALLI